MAHFYGTVQGQAGETSRLGSKKSGLTATANGWTLGARCSMNHYIVGGEDFDALTVAVMVEHCEPELTLVDYWWVQKHVFKYATWQNYLPKRHRTCLQCLLNRVAKSRPDDGRGSLLRAVREGQVQVVGIEPPPEGWQCPICRVPLHGAKEHKWKNFIP